MAESHSRGHDRVTTLVESRPPGYDRVTAQSVVGTRPFSRPPSLLIPLPSLHLSLTLVVCTLLSESLVMAWSRHITAPGLGRVTTPGHDRITACRPPIPLNSVSSPLARMHGKTPERASARAPTHLHIPLSESSSDKSSVEAPDTRAHAPDAIVHSRRPPPIPPFDSPFILSINLPPSLPPYVPPCHPLSPRSRSSSLQAHTSAHTQPPPRPQTIQEARGPMLPARWRYGTREAIGMQAVWLIRATDQEAQGLMLLCTQSRHTAREGGRGEKGEG